MANNYTTYTADDELLCDAHTFGELRELIEEEVDEDDSHDFVLSLCDGKLHMYAELAGNTDYLPEPFLKRLGALIAANGRDFWQFGYADTCDKMRPGSHGGGQMRITKEGEVVYPTVIWPI
jgi:hypothetical protein